MRFKPPPVNSNIGWRVEFRSMDIQLTDHENAAFSIFVVLLTRTILHFDLNLYMPLSQVDLNMETAQKRDAVSSEKFWFRNFISPSSSVEHEAFEQLTVNEIMNGSRYSKGLVSLVDQYIDEVDMGDVTRLKLKRYTNVVRQKASGARMTGAKWIRNFVQSHPDYHQDSKISARLNHDLCKAILELYHDDFLTR